MSNLESIVGQLIIQQDAEDARRAPENRAAYDAIAKVALADGVHMPVISDDGWILVEDS
jgi:hypothetical protein